MSKHFTNMREMMMKNEPLEEKGHVKLNVQGKWVARVKMKFD